MTSAKARAMKEQLKKRGRANFRAFDTRLKTLHKKRVSLIIATVEDVAKIYSLDSSSFRVRDGFDETSGR